MAENIVVTKTSGSVFKGTTVFENDWSNQCYVVM